MSRLRLCEISDGGHFFVHDAEGTDLAKIEAKLKELKDKVGALGRFYIKGSVSGEGGQTINCSF